MEHEIAKIVWNEFIAQSLNEGMKFSFKDLEKRIKEVLNSHNLSVSDSLLNSDKEIKTKNSEVLLCECNSTEHQIIIRYDREEQLVYCNIHLVKHGFWKRLKAGLKYIFGYKCIYGQWDEFVFTKEDSEKIKDIYNFLNDK